MGGLSNFAKDALVNHLINTAYTPPATVYLALCTADPTAAGTGASMNETADAQGYARTTLPFSAASGREVIQTSDIAFPEATGSYAAPITDWAIVDSATHGAGNMLAFGALVNARQPVTGNVLRVTTALQEVEVEIQASSGAGLSDYAVHALLNLMFRNVAFTSPSGATYVALSQTVLDDQDVAIGDFTEVTGTGYARKLCDANGGSSPTWTTVSGGTASNAAEIDFGTVGAGGWTNFVAGLLIDSVSGAGNILGFDSAGLVDQSDVLEDDTVAIPIGSLDITLS
jgi:hypothetical protein